ncbi:U3 small nucleolar RNA-associated protein 15 homolog [Paramacrobiotus metropolitanus]|uniref:U3 small nucleolar RNA-associated protein 15 homolog n=1 Tax=Paramacrobiotus metropolitanus TaxID=2943436 RepID=UPI002445A61D|nr:U3 small nucleolar RNA-associated protein 15 homolog [Paramacrobiotus metropolitanus]
MASFRPIERKRLPRLKGELTAENKYWTDFSFPVTIKEYGPIQNVSFSKKKPHLCAVTSSAKVQIIDPVSLESSKTFSRFKEAARGAEFRSDGKLLSVGGEEGIVRVFDVGTKSLLREFKNHRNPVHCTQFTCDNTHLVSFGDDRSARYFDIPAQMQVRSFKDHGDYVRAGDTSASSPDMMVSGCYDHKARLFDLREKSPVVEVNHGAPVETVLMFPNGNVFLTAGGTTIKVWDVVSPASPLASLSYHHKTITDLCFASNYSRFLSSSIDRHVKVYDVATYQMVHSFDFPAQVLSVGVSMDDELMCVGMADGVISMHKRKPPVDEEAQEMRRLEKRPFGRYLMREKTYQPDEDAIVVREQSRPHLARHDKYLKTFQFSKALSRVMKQFIWGPMPDVTVSVIQEIDRRGGLPAAVGGRTDLELVDILWFVCTYITDPRFSQVVLGLADLLWKVYPCMYGRLNRLDELISKFQDVLQREVDSQVQLKLIMGRMDVLINASNFNNFAMDFQSDSDLDDNADVPTNVPSANVVK